MRKQYYFRPSEHGLMAWDVDRLISLTRHLPRVQVPLTDIREIDEPFCSDDDTPTWRAMVEHIRLIEAADLSFAIILSADGRVMDGMHRVANPSLRSEALCVAELSAGFVDKHRRGSRRFSGKIRTQERSGPLALS